jgi:cell division protein FtsL
MRAVKQKKISLFNLMVMLFISAGVIVFFVNNIISVNAIAVENNNMLSEINKTTTINNNLQTEIERLTNYDNIKNIAVGKLGLKFPVEKPKKITVDKSELETISQ